MQKKPRIGIFIVIALIIIIGSYFLFFQKNSPIGDLRGIFSGKTYSEDVSSLVLDMSELPEGYRIAERTPRLKSDISELGIDWGWIEGYYIRYIKGNEDNIFDVSAIGLSISRYPLKNVSNGIDNSYEYEGYTAEKLPNPNIGEGSAATRYTDNSSGLRSYRIEFYKKDIYVTFDNEGATTDYELLRELAKKISDKI